MNLKFVLLFFALFLVPFVGCKKDIVKPNDGIIIENEQTPLSQLKTQEEKNFFTKNYITQNNPNILPSIRDRNDEELFDSVYNFMYEKHLETGFVTGLMEANGYPIWDMSEIAEDDAGTPVKMVITPYANVDEDFTSAYTIGIPSHQDHADPWTLFLVTRAQVYSLVQQYSYDENPELGYHVYSFLHFDELLFGSLDPVLDDWFPDVIRGSQEDEYGGHSGSRTVSYCICRCAPQAFTSDNVARGGATCPPGTYAVCDEIFVSCNSDDDGTTSGSGTGGTVNTGSSTPSGGAGGSSTPNYDHVAIDDHIQDCLASLAAAEAGGDVDQNDETINDNPAYLSSCGELIEVAEMLGLINESGQIVNYELLGFLMNISKGRALVSAFASIPNPSPEKIEVMNAYALHLLDGGEMEFRAFEVLYKKVYFDLVPDLGLDDTWLMEHPNETNDIHDFYIETIEEYGTDVVNVIQQSALLFITLEEAGLLDGPYDEDFDAIIEEEVPGPGVLSIAISFEFASLKEAHPDWGNGRLWLTALRNVFLDELHIVLGGIGLVPGAGEVADLVSGGIYTLQGEYLNASLSYSSAIPVLGWFSTSTKWAKKVLPGRSIKLIWKKVGADVHFPSDNLLRSQLKRIMNTPSGQQAHHVIPLQHATMGGATASHGVVQAAAKGADAWHPNELANGFNLPLSRHNGSHANYNNRVKEELDEILSDYNNSITPAEAAIEIRLLAERIRDAIVANPNTHINDLIW